MRMAGRLNAHRQFAATDAPFPEDSSDGTISKTLHVNPKSVKTQTVEYRDIEALGV